MNKYTDNQLYPYLREVFNDLMCAKSGQIKTIHSLLKDLRSYKEVNHLGEKSFASLYEPLGLTGLEFYQKYVEPWTLLTPEQAIEVAKYCSLKLTVTNQFQIEVNVACNHQALHWTLVNVYQTNLFNVFLEDYEAELSKNEPPENWDWVTHQYVAPQYSLPYRQCSYCGRLDEDPRGKNFGKNDLAFCHLESCPSDPTPSRHSEGCCYGDWKRLKNNIRATCRRLSDDPQEVSTAFFEFCKNRYQENLKLLIPVRVQKAKPYKWSSVLDPLSFSVHPGGIDS